MSAEAWLEDLLPTKWSRRLAVATVAAAGAAFGVPSLLPQSYLPASPEQVFLFRLVLLLLVALVGSLTVLVLVVREFNSQSLKHKADIEALKNGYGENTQEESLTDVHERVLGLLFESPRTVEEVCEVLGGVNRERGYFYLHDLAECGMASPPAPYSAGPEEWHISQEGRRHVMRRRAP
jgi:hypothetical protein